MKSRHELVDGLAQQYNFFNYLSFKCNFPSVLCCTNAPSFSFHRGFVSSPPTTPSPSAQLEVQLKDELRRAAHRKFQTQLHLVTYNKEFQKYVEITSCTILCRFEESQKLVDKSTDRLVSLIKCRRNWRTVFVTVLMNNGLAVLKKSK